MPVRKVSDQRERSVFPIVNRMSCLLSNFLPIFASNSHFIPDCMFLKVTMNFGQLKAYRKVLAAFHISFSFQNGFYLSQYIQVPSILVAV